MRVKKLQNKFIIVLFIAVLALPALDMIFHFSPVKELFEKRLPVEKPTFPRSLSELKEYPRNFEKFFNDDYGMRKSFITLYGKMMDKIFDESPDARAVVGKDGWFFFDNCNSLLDATGKAQLDDVLVAKGVENFIKNWRQLREKNVDYLVVIAADKSSVYPEFLPDYIKPSDLHRIDKFISALKQKAPDFPLLDLRPILLEAKKRDSIIYHETDTHWNRRGAHYGYVSMMKKLGAKPHLRSEFVNKEDDTVRGDISDIMGVDTKNLNRDLAPKFKTYSQEIEGSKVEKAEFHRFRAFENLHKNLPRAFVYHDSFYGELFDLANEHFSFVASANESPCDINYDRIRSYKPNVIIHEFWEGRIELIMKRCN
jgi:alginate O-acetyltransferase complex protein AlgJ